MPGLDHCFQYLKQESSLPEDVECGRIVIYVPIISYVAVPMVLYDVPILLCLLPQFWIIVSSSNWWTADLLKKTMTGKKLHNASYSQPPKYHSIKWEDCMYECKEMIVKQKPASF